VTRAQAEVRFFIVQDYRENRSKCTALPLKVLQGFDFLRLPPPRAGETPAEIPGGVWLLVDGSPLERSDRDHLGGDGRVVLFDATWARLEALRRRVRPPPGARPQIRSLPADLRTAYPRRSKVYTDPAGGLASVEAIFSATVVLGDPRLEVLAGYRWARKFLEINRRVFQRAGWEPP
jgi:pre-rRNA-processing protein TSR3